MESQLSEVRSRQHSEVTSTSRRVDSINEALTRFALNAGIALDAATRALYVKMWLEDFSDVPLPALEAAFVACRQAYKFKSIPTVADIRGHLKQAGNNAMLEEAARKWEQVVAFAAGLSDDYADTRKTKILPRTMAAIRGAGGLRHIRDCKPESLEFARKNFIQAYIRNAELEHQQALLPDGEVEALLGYVAERLLPA